MSTEFLDLVDPDLRDIAQYMRNMYEGLSPMSMEKLEARRAGIAAMATPPLPGIPVEEKTIPGIDGHPDVTIFIVNAGSEPAAPGAMRRGILHLHGGGFNASSARSGLPNIQALAAELGCVAVTVEYRLAPETPYPGALMDSYATLAWLHKNGAQFGVDPSGVVLLGESAGGGHAALLSLYARDRNEFNIAFQALIYPMLDDRTASSRPVPAHIGAFGWNADANRFGWQCFLGQPPGTDLVPEAAVPARSQNLAGLPPTFIGTGALDLFVSEDIAFAHRLITAGVPTELQVVPGAIHGFDMLAKDSAVSKRFHATKLAVLRRALGAGDAPG
jgi:acetyl esterase/lipase